MQAQASQTTEGTLAVIARFNEAFKR